MFFLILFIFLEYSFDQIILLSGAKAFFRLAFLFFLAYSHIYILLNIIFITIKFYVKDQFRLLEEINQLSHQR